MKHTIELKLPKLFGKKKVEVDEMNKSLVTTEVEPEDIKEAVTDKVVEFVTVNKETLTTVGITLAVGYGLGYVKGSSKVAKQIGKQAINVIVVK